MTFSILLTQHTVYTLCAPFFLNHSPYLMLYSQGHALPPSIVSLHITLFYIIVQSTVFILYTSYPVHAIIHSIFILLCPFPIPMLHPVYPTLHASCSIHHIPPYIHNFFSPCSVPILCISFCLFLHPPTSFTTFYLLFCVPPTSLSYSPCLLDGLSPAFKFTIVSLIFSLHTLFSYTMLHSAHSILSVFSAATTILSSLFSVLFTPCSILYCS